MVLLTWIKQFAQCVDSLLTSTQTTANMLQCLTFGLFDSSLATKGGGMFDDQKWRVWSRGLPILHNLDKNYYTLRKIWKPKFIFEVLISLLEKCQDNLHEPALAEIPIFFWYRFFL